MKITFIGGGAHRYISTARSMLDNDQLDISEIALYDINTQRAGIVGRFIEKTPEFRAKPCRVSWNQSLDKALEGADIVNIVIFVADALTHELATHACGRHGFICSQQMTPSGALNSLKIGAVVLDIARRMEKLCPDAWLVDFSNPVAVVSGVVNHHTKIFGLGVCEGYSNHLWDIPRLFGKDEMATDINVHCAGINHLSFISPSSTWNGRNLYAQIDELIASGPWVPPKLNDCWSKDKQTGMIAALEQLLIGYKRYGRMLFSTEIDGVATMNISGLYEPWAERLGKLTRADAEKAVANARQQRLDADKRLSMLLEKDNGQIDWNNPDPQNVYLQKKEGNMMVLCARARAGETIRLTASVPNNGAIADIPERFMVEFSQVIIDGQIRPSEKHSLTPALYPWVAAFSAHQTLLADAVACDCPETLFQAVSCYPVNRDSTRFWKMWREVFEISKDDISPNLAKVIDLLPKV